MVRETRAKYQTIRVEHGLAKAGLYKCTGNAVKVYQIIQMHINYTTGKSYPTFETIRGYTGIVENKRIKKAIVELRDKGFIEFVFRKLHDKSGREIGRKRYVYRLCSAEDVFETRRKKAFLEGAKTTPTLLEGAKTTP